MTRIIGRRMKNKRVNRAWLHDHLNDPYVKLAQKEGYRARAAYKLKEIDETLKLLTPGQRVVDLGASPGAWSQYLRRKFAGPGGTVRGTIVALDLLDFEPVDVVVSDMAPNLSGIESADSARIAHLVELAVDFSVRHLKPGGALVCKVFHGSGYSQLVELFKRNFRTVKPIKPKASRDRSSETFLVGIGVKGAANPPGPQGLDSHKLGHT